MSALTDEQLQAAYNSALKHGHLAAIKEVAKSVMLYVPTIPEGYALVPIEPNDEMLRNGSGPFNEYSIWEIGAIWRSMLAAAPKPDGASHE